MTSERIDEDREPKVRKTIYVLPRTVDAVERHRIQLQRDDPHGRAVSSSEAHENLLWLGITARDKRAEAAR